MNTKYDLQIDLPWMNAAGCLGFWPDPRAAVDLSRLGAFVTNPISLKPRSPAHGRRFFEYPGGFLLHTGYPNPGLRIAIKRYATRWARAPVPVLVHLLAQDVDETVHMVQRLEAIDGVMGVEIGLPLEIPAESARLVVEASLGELPVIARLPFGRATELANSLLGLGIAAVSLGPPRGMVPVESGDYLRGRLYGPAIFPQALAKVQVLQQYGFPVVGAGGVFKEQDAESMLESGAMAVQLDAVLWGDWSKVTGGEMEDLPRG
jgi:dihydroorotate dehydrogenase